MSSLFIAYEDFLIGRTSGISNYYFYGTDAGGANENVALSCFRYAIENLLQWSPSVAIRRFDNYIIEQLKLDKIMNYIHFPVEIEKGSAEYILSRLYPQHLRLTQKDLVEKIYIGVLRNSRQFPREYFVGADGFRRFCYCLRYLIVNYLVFYHIEEVYQFFYTKKGIQMLSAFRLRIPAIHLGISLYDAIYAISKDNEDSRLYYCYYKFQEKLKRE